MGTDIHLYVERRENERWLSCDTWEPSEWQAGHLTVAFGKHYYDQRSYDTFAILANVRNGTGFAGCDTGDGFKSIAEPRGLPEDLSAELEAEAQMLMQHTPSWLLLSELISFDWTQVATKRGWINGPALLQWSSWARRAGEGPSEYCSWISGDGIEHITEEELQAHLDATKTLPWKERLNAAPARSYAQVEWKSPYYKCASVFLSECLPRLWRLGTPENVRIVFWFDS